MIATAKVLLPDPPSAASARRVPVAAPLRTIFVRLPPLEAHAADHFERQLVRQMQRSLRRAHVREIIWLSVAVAEVTVLVVLRLIQH